MQVKTIHNTAEKFASLIPCFISSLNIDNVEADWEKEVIDIPLTSKLRVYAGWVFNLTLRHLRLFVLFFLDTFYYISVFELLSSLNTWNWFDFSSLSRFTVGWDQRVVANFLAHFHLTLSQCPGRWQFWST